MKQVLELATGPVAYSVRGDGPPIIVLHRDVVSPTDSPFLSALAEHYEVYAIDLPGFGASPRPAWLRNVTQLGTLTLHGIKALDLPASPLIGLGFGGWVAADIATQDNSLVSELILVSPWGVKPTNGEIADFVLYSLEEWASLGFHDPSNYIAYCGDGIEPDVLRSLRRCSASYRFPPWSYGVLTMQSSHRGACAIGRRQCPRQKPSQ